MTETETAIGQLRLVSDGGRLKVSSAEGFEHPVVLSSDEVSELLVYLVSLSSSDFNQRQSYRIPLWNGIKLGTTLVCDSESVNVSPVNLSLTGMLVELPENCTVEFEAGQFVEAKIELEGKSALLPVRIERTDGIRCGLDLSGSADGETDLFPVYSDIVMTIQQRWAARFRND